MFARWHYCADEGWSPDLSSSNRANEIEALIDRRSQHAQTR